jgi:5'-nucleotidase
MPVDLSQTLVVAVSSTALFDLAEQNQAFQEALALDKNEAIEAYRHQMRAQEDELLGDGVAMPVVKALLRLNDHSPKGGPPIVEVLVMSRNSPETGLRVLYSIRSKSLPITRSAFTGGEPVAPLLRAFSVDLFLGTEAKDVQQAIDERLCAAAIVRGKHDWTFHDDGRVRIAFDGDAVLFSEDSEHIYKTRGMDEFHQNEDANRDVPLAEGPYARLLKKLATMQERLPTRVEFSPVRISIVTARNAPSELRVIHTLRRWNVYVDEIYFLGGLSKTPILEALKPHIFFDDQDAHLEAAESVAPSGKVPYPTSSPLNSAGTPAVANQSPQAAGPTDTGESQ